MARDNYSIISETTEDRFDETDNLDEAIRIARDLVKKSQAGDPISIEHKGRVVRQFVLTPEGVIEEPEVGLTDSGTHHSHSTDRPKVPFPTQPHSTAPLANT